MSDKNKALIRWALAQSEACQDALLKGTAAVMPIRAVPIVHGASEFVSPGIEIMYWAEKSLQARLDVPKL